MLFVGGENGGIKKQLPQAQPRPLTNSFHCLSYPSQGNKTIRLHQINLHSFTLDRLACRLHLIRGVWLFFFYYATLKKFAPSKNPFSETKTLFLLHTFNLCILGEPVRTLAAKVSNVGKCSAGRKLDSFVLRPLAPYVWCARASALAEKGTETATQINKKLSLRKGKISSKGKMKFIVSLRRGSHFCWKTYSPMQWSSETLSNVVLIHARNSKHQNGVRWCACWILSTAIPFPVAHFFSLGLLHYAP